MFWGKNYFCKKYNNGRTPFEIYFHILCTRVLYVNLSNVKFLSIFLLNFIIFRRMCLLNIILLNIFLYKLALNVTSWPLGLKPNQIFLAPKYFQKWIHNFVGKKNEIHEFLVL